MTQAKSRQKKETSNESMNYLSLFQLNPSLLYAAANVNPAQPFQQPASPAKSPEQLGIKIEDEDFYENNQTSEIFESVQEQKLLNTAFDIIEVIESSLQNNYESGENCDDKVTPSYLSNLLDENTTQFQVQIPQILHPKMQVCEIGSRILFKTIDWLKDNDVWKYFEDEDQSAMLQLNWAELLVIGLAQVVSSSNQAVQLKSMIVSTLVNYVKSLIIYSTNESSQIKLGRKGEIKSASGQKIKKMLSNIVLIKNFIDEMIQLRKLSFFLF